MQNESHRDTVFQVELIPRTDVIGIWFAFSTAVIAAFIIVVTEFTSWPIVYGNLGRRGTRRAGFG